jgi:hypothetical protein
VPTKKQSKRYCQERDCQEQEIRRAMRDRGRRQRILNEESLALPLDELPSRRPRVSEKVREAVMAVFDHGDRIGQHVFEALYRKRSHPQEKWAKIARRLGVAPRALRDDITRLRGDPELAKTAAGDFAETVVARREISEISDDQPIEPAEPNAKPDLDLRIDQAEPLRGPTKISRPGAVVSARKLT